MKNIKISQNQFEAQPTPFDNANQLKKYFEKTRKFSPDLICTPECSNIITNDINYLRNFWEPVKKGILFSLSLQHNNGAIAWNIDEFEKIDEDYLLTGCSSIAKSLECAIAICQVLEHKSIESGWRDAHSKLIVALENPAEIFDLKKDRSRFSMDWYYPILGGINSKQRLSLIHI